MLVNTKIYQHSASRTSLFPLNHPSLPLLPKKRRILTKHRHYQAAQPITVGRRAAQWLQELVFDLEDVEYVRENLKYRGAQGTTGTQASFLEIFKGDGSKVDKLNEILCEKAGFPSCYDISTQTYTRKVDLRVANALSAFGATAVRVASVRRAYFSLGLVWAGELTCSLAIGYPASMPRQEPR